MVYELFVCLPCVKGGVMGWDGVANVWEAENVVSNVRICRLD